MGKRKEPGKANLSFHQGLRTLEELLADEEVELVVVNTPNYTHYDYAKRALLAGKHVILEKPFTVTEKEGLELIALAKEVGKS